MRALMSAGDSGALWNLRCQVREGLVAQGPPPAEWMFDWVYAEPPSILERQRREALR